MLDYIFTEGPEHASYTLALYLFIKYMQIQWWRRKEKKREGRKEQEKEEREELWDDIVHKR